MMHGGRGIDHCLNSGNNDNGESEEITSPLLPSFRFLPLSLRHRGRMAVQQSKSSLLIAADVPLLGQHVVFYGLLHDL